MIGGRDNQASGGLPRLRWACRLRPLLRPFLGVLAGFAIAFAFGLSGPTPRASADDPSALTSFTYADPNDGETVGAFSLIVLQTPDPDGSRVIVSSDGKLLGSGPVTGPETELLINTTSLPDGAADLCAVLTNADGDVLDETTVTVNVEHPNVLDAEVLVYPDLHRTLDLEAVGRLDDDAFFVFAADSLEMNYSETYGVWAPIHLESAALIQVTALPPSYGGDPVTLELDLAPAIEGADPLTFKVVVLSVRGSNFAVSNAFSVTDAPAPPPVWAPITAPPGSGSGSATPGTPR